MDNPATPPVLLSRPEPRQGGAQPAKTRTGGLLGALKIWQKLLLIALVLALPLLFLVGRDLVQQNRVLQDAYKERSGVAYLNVLERVLFNTTQHRGLTTALLNGDASVGEARGEFADTLRQNLADLARLDAQTGAGLQTTEAFTELRGELESLLETSGTLNAEASFRQHSQIISGRVVPLISQVATTSTLILTEDLDTYFLGSMVRRQLPNLAETVGQLRGNGVGILTRGEGRATEAERREIANFISLITVRMDEVAGSVETIRSEDPALAAKLNTFAERAFAEAEAGIILAENVFLNVRRSTLTPQQFFAEATYMVEAFFALNSESLGLLGERTEGRIAVLERNRLVEIAAVLLGLLLITTLVALVARRISRPIGELVGVAESVSQGDLSRTATVTSSDEIGTLGTTFNTAIVQLREAAERNELELQRSRDLQGNISNFLDVAMTIADGDFTKRGQVSEDVLGNVVDAINLMVEELSYLLKNVQDTVYSVRDGADEMIQTSGSISERSRLQVSQAQSAREEVRRVTGSMLEMAQNADASADAARRALKASQQGEEAVQNTLAGMQGIRREVQGISKRIKGLGDRSLEISEIVETISRISRQTNLLALNAAIEAAGAGEAGGRFAIVANEVRKLADDSAQATQRVAALIKTVQSEVQEVVGSVEGGTREVEEGYRVAGEAGERLREIGQIVTQAAEYAVNISQATQQQVRGVEQVGSAVNSIAGATEASQVQINQGRKTAQRLEELSSELSANLARFRLA